MAELFGEIANDDRFRIELSLEAIGGFGGFTLYQEAHPLLTWIGTLYQALHKAKAIAMHFKVCRRVPATITGKDLYEIDVLYDLIQGREIPDPRPLDQITIPVNAKRLSAAMGDFSQAGATDLSLFGEADAPFLGSPVHIDNCVRLIRKAKMTTRKSDITRRLNQSAETINLRIRTTPESEQMIKLADTVA